MTDVAKLIIKAQRASASAALLLGQGDIDGACNRAYYAMFDAARAALLGTGVDRQVSVLTTASLPNSACTWLRMER